MESIFKSGLETKILDLCETHLGPRGFRAVDVDCHVGGRSLVRVFIERQKGEVREVKAEGGASIDDCADASRLLGAVLDTIDLVPGAYDLEVSSPGLDRRLRLRSDFETALGEEVKFKLTESLEGRGANLTGTLLRVEDQGLVVKLSGEERKVPWDKIKRANKVYRFK